MKNQLPKLNIMEKSIEHKYREGKVKRTLIKELKELETTKFNQKVKRYRCGFNQRSIPLICDLYQKSLKITSILFGVIRE
jgi:hypothetical protein